jgi:cellulose biosynthesis protein BcsQ
MASKQARRHKSKRIAIFNHKGGVGKTTLTLNIASALSSLGKTVLLVDSDPQCNLSAYVVEEDVLNDLLDSSDSDAGGTIWSAIKPISEAAGDTHIIKPVSWLKKSLLIPGDVRLSEFEPDLNQFWNECVLRKTRGFRGTAAISMLVNTIASDYGVDYVFYDSGPNIGPLNRIILLDCDHFIVPAACDLFSIRALKTLGRTLERWILDWRTIADFAPEGTYLLPGRPRFLGYIPQRYRVYRGNVSQGYSSFLPRIERHISSDIVNVLRGIDVSLASSSMALNKLGLIKDFGTLANAAQTQGEPIYDVNAGTPVQRQEAKDAFVGIARRIIERTEQS